MNVKVSVIVPVYNVGKYIARCLDSILAQTLHDFEIICVNDGSTDNSQQIIEHYAQFDARVKIINSEHKGLAAARNLGISATSGEYLLFVNSDDYISSLTIDKLYKNATKNNSDVVIFDFVWKNTTDESYVKTTIKEFKNYYQDTPFSADKMGSLSYKLIPTSAWTKFYKTDLIKDKIKFEEDIIYCDIPFWTIVYTSAQRITYITDPLYYYNVGRLDALSAVKDDGVFDIIKAYKKTEQVLKDAKLWKKYKDSVYALMMPEFFNKYNMVTPNLKEEFYNSVKAMKKEINYKVYDCDSYNDIERICAKQFQTLEKVDHQTFWNSLIGGKI